MSMMRRGPLDRYLPAWVLRQAAAAGFDGSISFDRSRTITFFFDAGHLYAGTAAGDDGVDLDRGADDDGEEDERRAALVDLLIEAQVGVGGWYSLDPLGQHPALGHRHWEVEDLLAESRTESPEVTAASICGNQRIARRGDAPAPTTVDPDALALLDSLAQGSVTTEEARTTLGWMPARLLTALMKLHREGLLETAPEPEPSAPAPGEGTVGLDQLYRPGRREHEDDPSADGEASLHGPHAAGAAPADRPAKPHLKQDLGIDENAPANMALRAWQEHQIPEVILDPLVAPEGWLPPLPDADEAEPEPRLRRFANRRGRRTKDS